MAMLILAAATFHAHGLSSIGTIQEAYKMLTPLLGGAASFVFAISLLASGHASSTVGTMAGQVIMQGFHSSKDPDVDQAPGNHDALLHRNCLEARSHPDIGFEPGSIELWAAFCDHSIDFLYGQPWDNGRVGESQDHQHCRRLGGCVDRGLKYLPGLSIIIRWELIHVQKHSRSSGWIKSLGSFAWAGCLPGKGC